MMPTAARVVAANAAVIAGGAASCSGRSAAAISWARVSRLRCRPACLSAERTLAKLRRAASAGVGGAPQNGQGITVCQVVERLQRTGVVLAQSRAQCVGVPGAGPDQVLVPSG